MPQNLNQTNDYDDMKPFYPMMPYNTSFLNPSTLQQPVMPLYNKTVGCSGCSGCQMANMQTSPNMMPFSGQSLAGTMPKIMMDLDDATYPSRVSKGDVDQMCNCPYFQQQNNIYDSLQFREEQFSYVRLLHASPDAPAVDVYLNDNLIARNLIYRNFTQYLKVPTGTYSVRVFPTGTTNSPVINTNFISQARSIYTIAVIGMLKNISLFPILEPNIPTPSGTSLIRFIHLSPNTPPVDITLPDGKKLFTDVSYKEVTGYIPLRPGTYTLEARPTGTDKVALIIPSIKLLPNRILSIYAVGLIGEKPPLQVLIPLDGNTYLKF